MGQTSKVQNKLLDIFRKTFDKDKFAELTWEGSFEEYLAICMDNPRVIRNSFQRLYDMIVSYGMEEYTWRDETIIRYKFFSDPIGNGRDAIYGLDRSLMHLVNTIKAAAYHYGPEKRIILLHGPVGSAKSTVVRLLKKGYEAYSRTKEGSMFTFSWRDENDPQVWHQCPMHEEPLKLIPSEYREPILKELNSKMPEGSPTLSVEGDICPFCRWYFNYYIRKYKGDYLEALKQDVKIQRLVLSEKDRVGIGTFQPKDEKNQDSTELTGDINYRKIAIYGSDSDPRAFNFDGEFNVANRGIIEFIEILKLDVAFLYDLLGATQEHSIKPKKFSQTDIDEVIIAHTNEPEYKKLQNNEYMEAFRDRTLKIDFPYNLRLDNEIKIYERDFGPDKLRGRHLAPHTIEVAAMWAILTRLQESSKCSLIQKMYLYNGKLSPEMTDNIVDELKKASPREGMEGASPRYIQDKLSSVLAQVETGGCVNPFKLLNELDRGLDHHSLITSEDQKMKYRKLLSEVKQEYEEIVRSEVQRAICADEEAINRLFSNYIENVKAYCNRQKIKDRFTGEEREPDERLMRSIEEKMEIEEGRKNDFRMELMSAIAALALEGKKFNYKSDERLHKALEQKLFEDQKDSIKLSSLVTGVPDKDTQEKIDVVKSRLIKQYKYCEICAIDALNFVASVFARTEQKKEK